MRRAGNSMFDGNKLKLGLFSPNCSGGMAVTTVSPLWPMRAATKAAFVTRARWDSNAPFGLPVVPDVNCICAAACGETSGKVDEFRHCDNVTARSSIGMRSIAEAAVLAICSISVPRKAFEWMIALESDCSNTC